MRMPLEMIKITDQAQNRGVIKVDGEKVDYWFDETHETLSIPSGWMISNSTFDGKQDLVRFVTTRLYTDSIFIQRDFSNN